MSVAALVQRLGLVPHPEGGYFKETWRAAESLPASALPARFSGPRSHATAILYLLERGDFSALHKIAGDEVWCFHEGAPLIVHTLSDGQRRDHRLDRLSPQAVVPHGAWFGARLDPDGGGDYTLVSCVVAPGFDFADFELATPALAAAYPEHAALIATLTSPRTP